jgi:RNA chaperone Hfq
MDRRGLDSWESSGRSKRTMDGQAPETRTSPGEMTGGVQGGESGSAVQNRQLHEWIGQRLPVTVSLANGVKVRGVIEGFDKFMVHIRGSDTHAIYKQAIAVIAAGNEGVIRRRS